MRLDYLDFKDKLDSKKRNTTNLAEDIANRPIFLFGAGQTALHIMSNLNEDILYGLIDETPEKQGQAFHGKKIFSFEDVINKFHYDFCVVISIFSPRASYIDIKNRLVEKYNLDPKNIFSIWDISLFQNKCMPYYHFDLPEKILARLDRYELINQKLGKESQKVLKQFLNLRILGSYTSLDKVKSIFELLIDKVKKTDEIFYIDGGAFDGDTVLEFINSFQGFHYRVFAFEPDKSNYAKLISIQNDSSLILNQNFFPEQKALWSSRQRLPFRNSGDMGSSIDESSPECVLTESIDGLMDQIKNHQCLIKFDLEGVELEALKGAVKVISLFKPILIISVYHKVDDLLEIFNFIEELVPNSYKYELRQFGADGSDLLLYAIPN